MEDRRQKTEVDFALTSKIGTKDREISGRPGQAF
jgi:hypothetical protein